MLRRFDKKALSEITAEWDALAPLRYQQISSGLDISYNKVIVPALLRLLANSRISNALDAGCGTGVFTAKLSEIADRVVGIDPSRNSIQIARSLRLNHTSFVRATAEEYSIEHEFDFDAVTANMVLMDVLNLHDFLQACRRMLKTGGVFVFSITHPCFWPEYYGYSGESWFHYEKELIVESPFRISADRIGSLVSTHIHRPIEAYLNAFTDCGFTLSTIIEPLPPTDVDPAYKAAWKFPRYIVGLLRA
jgi:SAM-dependent methyltransferase